MKFILFCEGPTEKNALPTFLARWLDARLSCSVRITPVEHHGWRELYDEAPKKAELHLREKDVIAVISLLDLYGPDFYPKNLTTVDERYEWAKKHIEEKVGQSKFRQFFAVHEVEAWLLSDLNIFPREIRSGFPGNAQHPETVNFNEPPAKLLGRLYGQRLKQSYKKVTYGKELFDKLSPETAVQKCPRLKEMLDEMLKLAKSAGL
jgi:hypothetical protein